MKAVHLPLSTLLSQTLVAFTIEFDNEFEHRMPHRTTNVGSTGSSRQGPWLVPLAMWANCMQFVSAEGIMLGELRHRARTGANLSGMQRWGILSSNQLRLATAPSRLAPTHWCARPSKVGKLRRSGGRYPVVLSNAGRCASVQIISARCRRQFAGPPYCRTIL